MDLRGIQALSLSDPAAAVRLVLVQAMCECDEVI